MPRFYVDAPLRAGTSCMLPEEAAHHALHVLRLRSGDEVTLFNGRGGEYAGRIASLDKRKLLIDVLQHREVEREAPLRMVLVQGVSSGERMDFTIRKAVELGVAEVRPVLAAASVARPKGERAAARREHWQKVAISACEQCGRNRIPEVQDLVSVQEAMKRDESRKILLSPRAELRFSEACRQIETAVTIAAGPEAGFNAAEEAAFLDAGYVPAKLGARVLRTETAALAALAALNALRGDF
jgi:16S rRNA (uracil1498-N3)-methyltransferase